MTSARQTAAATAAAAGSDDTPPAHTPVRLVVLGDSTSFTDDRGPQLPDDPVLYPNVLARELTDRLGRPVEVTVVARAGHTVREALRTATKDRHVQFDVVARADALVVGVGSFDHAPAGIPPVVDAVVPFLRPTALRRRVRTTLHAAYPWVVRATGGRRPRTSASEFDRQFRQLLDHLRGLTWGRAAGVVLGPTSHRSAYYAWHHRGHPAAEGRQLRIAAEHGFTGVATWPLVEPFAARLNPDGIHWPAPAHEAVGHAVADALAEMLRGDEPRIGLPARAAAALTSARSEARDVGSA